MSEVIVIGLIISTVLDLLVAYTQGK